jgi:transcriptional regulator with XRE-family HTH domain
MGEVQGETQQRTVSGLGATGKSQTEGAEGEPETSIPELAEKARVSPDTIWRIEGGNYKQLRPATMRRIAEALGVHPLDVAEFAPGAESAV